MRQNQGKRKAWTEKEDERLLSILRDPQNRLGSKLIGRMMGRGASSVLLRAKTLGFKPNRKGRLLKYDDEIIDQVRILKNQGVGNKEIALRLKLDHGQLHYIITRNQLGLSVGIWTEDDDVLLLECVRNKMKLDNISRKFAKSFSFFVKRFDFIFKENKPDYIIEFIHQEKNTKDKIIKTKLHFSKTRSLKEGWIFELSYDHILQLIEKQDNKCYYSGEEIAYQRYNGNCISFDRIDSNKGYTKDNVVLCCWDANRMKQDMRTDRFIHMCEKIAANKMNIDSVKNDSGRWNLDTDQNPG